MSEASEVDADSEFSAIRQRALTRTADETVVDESPAEAAPPAQSAVFSVLKNSRRRHVLRFLLAERRRVSLAELAVHIAAHENDVPPGAVTSAQRKRVYVSLYQSHLPKLDEVGAVDYNDARKYAHLADHLDAFRPYLQESTDDRRWSRWYLALGLLGAVGVGVASLAGGVVPPLGDGPLLSLAAGVLAVAFLAVALYHSLSAYDAR